MLVIIHPDFMCIIQYTVSAISHFRHYKSSASYAGVWDYLLHLSGLLHSFHSTVIILGRKDFLTHHLKALSISFKQNVCYILWHLVGKGIIFKQSSLPTPTNCLLSPFVAKVGGSISSKEITLGDGCITAGPCLFRLQYLMRGRVVYLSRHMHSILRLLFYVETLCSSYLATNAHLYCMLTNRCALVTLLLLEILPP